MNLEATVKNEIEKLHTIRYEEDEGFYKVVMRNPRIDPNIDQVVENIITIYAKYHLEQGE